jgi:PAS domain S-box-containing protein
MEKNQYSDLYLDQTKDLVWAVDKNLDLVFANRAYLNLMKEVTGVEKELNTPILVEGFGEGYIEKWNAYYLRALSGESFEIEEHFYNPETKEMQYGHIAFSPIRDERVEILTVACRSTDITPIIRQKDHASRLVDASLDVFCTIDEAGKFVFVSAASADHWGFRPEELVGQPFRDLIVAEDLEKTDLVAAEILAGKEFKTFSNRYRKKNGDVAYNLWSARWDHDSKLMYCVARDAKEKIEEEAEKELLSQISRSFNDEEELIPAANRLCENLYAYGKFDLIELWCPNMEQTKMNLISKSNHTQDFYELEPSEASFQKNEGLPGKVWEMGKQVLWDEKQIEKYFIRNNGASHLWLQAIIGLPLFFNDKLVGVLLIGTKRDPDYLDQTSSVFSRLEKFIGSEINRKRLENDLDHLYESIPDIVCVADLQGRFLKMNRAGCQLLGYSEEELLYHSYEEFVYPADKDISAKEVAKLGKGQSVFSFENRYVQKSGQLCWLSWTCNANLQEGIIYATARNITAEKKLRELNKVSSNMARIGSWEVDLRNNKLFWTEMVHKLHETDPQNFEPDLAQGINFYREDFRPMVTEVVSQCIESGTPFDFEAVIVTANKNELWVRSIGNAEFANGKCIRIYGSFQDIHERKEADLRLLSLADNLPGVVFQFQLFPDGTSKFLNLSKGVEKLYGIDAELIMKNNALIWDQVVAGGDIDKVQASITESLTTLTNWHVIYRNKLPNGKIIWLEGWGKPRRLPDGSTIWDSIVLEITDLKETEQLLASASKLARVGSWEIVPQDNQEFKVFWSSMTKNILEIDESFEPTIDSGSNFYKEPGRSLMKAAMNNAIETGQAFDLELELVSGKGNEIWIRCIGDAQLENGKVSRVYGSFQDIHQRKIAELRLQSLANDLPGVVFQYQLYPDGTDRLFTVSKGSQHIWGLSPEQCEADINLVWEQIRKGGDFEQVVLDITHSIQTKTQWHGKWRNVLPDGKVRWHEGFGTPYFHPDGTVIYNSMVFDFTDEKLAIDLYEEASEMAKIGNWELNLANQNATDNMYWSPMLKEILEVNEDYNPSLTGGFEFYEEDSKALIKEAVDNLMKSGTPFDLELLIQTAKGNNKWVRCIGSAEFVMERCVRIFGSFQDVHDRKIAEIQHKTLTDNLPGAVFQYLLHPDGQDQILYISEGSYQVWGLSPEECKRSPEKIWQQIEAGGYKEELVNSIKESAQNLTPWLAQWKNVSLDGTIKWYEGRGLPQRLPDRSVLWNSLIINITEKKEYEDKYQHALEERATILESISDAFYAVDSNWNFTYFNREAEHLLKKSFQEVLGGNIWEIFSPAKGTFLEEVYRRVVASGQSENFEYHYPGDGCWYEVTTYPSAGGVASYFKNIDERRKAAKELEKAFKEKNEILESIGDAFYAVDEDWTVTYWNKQAESVVGKKKEDVLGKNLWEEFPDAIDTDFYRQFNRAMETGDTINFEEYYATLDMWIEVAVYPSDNGLSIYFKDITLRKKADIRLLQANERFELVTKATNDAIWDWDIENDDFYRSDNIHKILGNSTSAKLKKNQFWKDAFHPDDLGKLKESIQSALNDPQSERWEMEYRVLNENDEELSIIDRGIIVRNKKGKATRMVGAMTDLTKQKRLEKELFQLNESLKNYAKELERSNEELEQFAFITSHDLQEPLRMISSFMDLLKRKYADQLDDKAHQYIHFATDGAKRMKQIILDLLLYSRANKPSEQLEEINLNKIVSEYTQLRRKLIAEKKAAITFDGLPVLQTFGAPITQIIHCLLDNALKYVKENVPPRIEIQAKEKEGFWEFSIKDNGIGIEEMFYDKIFVIFQRLHNRNQHDGTGIGLSIAKRSVEYLGGEIWLESKVGEGTTFYFTISKNK